jgi:pyridoxamine 5'-phosphate oxidase
MANEPQPPSYYDSLELSLAHAWHMLSRAVADRRAGFHTPAIATVALDGSPEVRTVVLRACDPSQRTLRFHTDMRSSKVQELKRSPHIALHFYDAHARLQLRVKGQAFVHSDDAIADLGWQKSQVQSRICYAAVKGPGQAISAPEVVEIANTLADDAARANFAVVQVTAERIEWLYLAALGHRRALWAYSDGAWQGQWLQP